MKHHTDIKLSAQMLAESTSGYFNQRITQLQPIEEGFELTLASGIKKYAAQMLRKAAQMKGKEEIEKLIDELE